MIHFAIPFALHRPQHTLTECVRSMYAAGVESMVLMPDDGRHGAVGNFHRALIELVSKAGAMDHVCVFQDDIVLCLHTLGLLPLKARPMDAHVLFTVEQNIPHERRAESGWVEANHGANTWGGAVVLPRSVAIAMMAHPFYADFMKANTRGTDVMTFETLRQMNVPVWHHLPSLADHIGGDCSTIGNTHGDETRGYRYNEWN